MYIPSHYFFLLVALLIGQSSVIFVYTLIGLINANPLPYIVPAPSPPSYVIACPQQVLSAVATIVEEQAPTIQTSTITTTIYSTVTASVTTSVTVTRKHSGQFPPYIPLQQGHGQATSPSNTESALLTLSSDVASSTMSSVASPTLRVVTSVVLTTKIIGDTTQPGQGRSTIFLTTTVAPKATN